VSSKELQLKVILYMHLYKSHPRVGSARKTRNEQINHTPKLVYSKHNPIWLVAISDAHECCLLGMKLFINNKRVTRCIQPMCRKIQASSITLLYVCHSNNSLQINTPRPR